MSYFKRGRPYQAGVLTIGTAGDVESFTLPANAEGFRLYDRSGTAVIKFAYDTPTNGNVLDGVEGNQPFRTAELAEADGRYETVPIGQIAVVRDIRFEKDTVVYVTAGADSTSIEVTVFE